MHIFTFEVERDYSDRRTKFLDGVDAAAYAAFHEATKGIWARRCALPAPPQDGEPGPGTSIRYQELEGVGTLEDLQTVRAFFPDDISIHVKRIRGLLYPGTEGVHGRMSVQEALRTASQASGVIHIHVPGSVSLLGIKTVCVMENSCTDELQTKLNDGWRIIAVCPPNDTRRPTYILGRE